MHQLCVRANKLIGCIFLKNCLFKERRRSQVCYISGSASYCMWAHFKSHSLQLIVSMHFVHFSFND